MPKPSHSLLSQSLRGRLSGIKAVGGNGSPTPSESDADHRARVDAMLEQMQHAMDIQLQRIGEMQVLIDRLLARTTPDQHD